MLPSIARSLLLARIMRKSKAEDMIAWYGIPAQLKKALGELRIRPSTPRTFGTKHLACRIIKRHYMSIGWR